MLCKFPVDVVLCVCTFKQHQNNVVISCGFIEDNNKLYLPSMGLTDDKHAAEIVVSMAKQLFGRHATTIDIVQLGFFDPINISNRHITLAYKTLISSVVPINANMRFLSYEEFRTQKFAKERDKIVARKGLAF